MGKKNDKKVKKAKARKANNSFADKYITEDDKKKPYKNPVFSTAGKIIICILALLMLFSGLIAVIVLMVQNMK